MYHLYRLVKDPHAIKIQINRHEIISIETLFKFGYENTDLEIGLSHFHKLTFTDCPKRHFQKQKLKIFVYRENFSNEKVC